MSSKTADFPPTRNRLAKNQAARKLNLGGGQSTLKHYLIESDHGCSRGVRGGGLRLFGSWRNRRLLLSGDKLHCQSVHRSLVPSPSMTQSLFILATAATGAAVLAATTNRIALVPWKRSKNAHWTERARLLFPVRRAALLNLLAIPTTIALAGLLWESESSPRFIALFLTALVGCLFGQYLMQRQFCSWLTFPRWFRSILSFYCFHLLRWSLFLVAIFLMPSEFNARAWAILAAVVSVHLLLLRGGTIHVARITRLVTPAGETLRRIVTTCSQRTRVRIRGIWIVHSFYCNAVALPFSRDIAYTDRALEVLPEDEVSAICAHEIRHLTEPNLVLAGRVLASMILLPTLALGPLCQRHGIWGFVGVLLCVCLGASLARLLSRRMEVRADHIEQFSLAERQSYGSALTRLYTENQIPAAMPKRQTHPDLYDRLLALGIQPDFSRPRRPSRLAWHGWLFSILVVLLWFVYIDRGMHNEKPVINGGSNGTELIRTPILGHLLGVAPRAADDEYARARRR